MRIAEIRKCKGITQVMLAEMIGVEQPTISKLERGGDGVTLRLLKKIADALDVNVSDLFVDKRSAAEDVLLRAFRDLSPDRQQGWLDMARTLSQK